MGIFENSVLGRVGPKLTPSPTAVSTNLTRNTKEMLWGVPVTRAIYGYSQYHEFIANWPASKPSNKPHSLDIFNDPIPLV